jgi:hypothetical protein
MREVVLENRACGACGVGGPAAHDGGYVFVEGRAGRFLGVPFKGALGRVTPERSGLAYAAGYAGVLSLFRYSFTYLTMSGWWPAWVLGKVLVLFCCLLAPLALVLSFAAAVSLDRAPWKSGRLPALVGCALGWLGSYTLLFLLDEVWRWLASLSLS